MPAGFKGQTSRSGALAKDLAAFRRERGPIRIYLHVDRVFQKML